MGGGLFYNESITMVITIDTNPYLKVLDSWFFKLYFHGWGVIYCLWWPK